jgi:DNA replication and repair protein RecF
MFLAQLSLINFRSHADARLQFAEKVAVFTGKNGCGKTNLLDAIHYLSFCKGFLNPSDVQNIHLKEGFFLIDGKFQSEEATLSLSCGLKRGQAKTFKRNGKEYERLSEHIGQIPLVVIAPTDIVLLSGGSEERRKFMDSVISQYDRSYLDSLIRYNRILKQRNVLLRQGNPDRTMIEVFDMQLVEFSKPIFEARKHFATAAEPLLLRYYKQMSGETESVSMQYESGLHQHAMDDLLKMSLERDFAMQYTTEGIHKDDIDLLINGYSLKRYASQGQQKTMLIALKLAQFDILQQTKQTMPLLLLDDIFEKLDQQRITALLNLIAQGHFGQIFITDSHPQRVIEILGSIDCAFDHFELPFAATNNAEA